MKLEMRIALLSIVAFALLSACSQPTEGTAPSTAKSDKPAQVKILSAAHLRTASGGEASPAGRLVIGRGKDYTPIPADPTTLFNQLEGSMAFRRQTAWTIVQAMLESQRLEIEGTAFEVPLWHTWFEGMGVNDEVTDKINLFIAELKACRDSGCTKTRDEIAREVVAAGGNRKNLAPSLNPENFKQVLRQAKLAQDNPEALLGRGFTLFSPAFVEHLLGQAQGIEMCSARIPWNKAPPSPTQFSDCLMEFPRAAVMVKTEWASLEPANPQVPFHATDAAAMQTLIRTGTWPAPKSAPVDPTNIYMVESSDGTRFALKAIHFSTKDTREWTWITLWWSPDANSDFGEDRPASIARFNGGVWSHYKMCVTTAFNEADPAPWSSFQAAHPSLAGSIQATAHELETQKGPPPYDKITSWCSNPNLETQQGNGRTNCIGCHQYSNTWNDSTNRPTNFGDTLTAQFSALYPQFGRARRRANFPTDFAWSSQFEFPPAIEQARTAQDFQW
jgi:hypothetical protein